MRVTVTDVTMNQKWIYMANENMRMSAAGLARLRQRERVVMRYYDDVAHNCTYGIGTLAHLGPCTDAELHRAVSEADVNLQLATGVARAESAVRRRVRTTSLTQAQFDALVSVTYNLGEGRARAILDSAERGDSARVVSHMNSNVYVHPRDERGRRRAPVRVQGLVTRRREESAPFRGQQ
jgi:lysozyme